MLDIRRFVQVVRKGAGQFGIFRMGLWIVPTDAFLATEDCVMVAQEFTVREVKIFKDAKFQPVPKPDATPDKAGRWAVGIQVER